MYGESEEDDDDDDEYDTGIISAGGDIDYDNLDRTPVLPGPGKKNPYDRRRQEENAASGGKTKGNSISANTINSSSSSGSGNSKDLVDTKFQLKSNNSKNKPSKNARPPTGSSSGNNYQQSVVVPINGGGSGVGAGRGNSGNLRVIGSASQRTYPRLMYDCISVISTLIIFEMLL